MAHNVLKMKYHPAKKMVEFEALQDGAYFSNYAESSLYLNYEKVPFVLQQHGNAFFETIRTFFNEPSSVDLEVTTTKTDYEDLEQMVEYYRRELAHRKINFQINVSLEAVLPEMDRVYDNVRKYGQDAVEILKHQRTDFYTISSDNKDVQESIAFFSKSLQDEVNNIQDKLNRMDDNNVNLCFAGIYNAGKSTLINAILGYNILPEAGKPTTARSFRIRSPKKDEKIHINFCTENARMTFAWDDMAGELSFSTPLAGDTFSTEISNLLEQCKEESQYKQMYQVLNYLNTNENVEPVIDVVFPIPLDTDNVHFTILDTPGTDSNTMQHGMVLREALSEQESSILIFVAPLIHATDGQGNRDLLELLKNEGKAIDLDRSIFVLNHADAVDSTTRQALKNGQIKTKNEQAEDDFQIDLASKKLFFTSAKAAYVAKAVRNNIATREETRKFNSLYLDAVDEDFGCYYKDNHCATSDYATSRMLNRCQDALKNAEGDRCQELFVCSGLFALEDEIVRYGEKYASAVRAHAIIESVDQALTRMSGKTASLAKRTDESLDEIEAGISRIRSALTAAIERQQQKFSIASGDRLTPETVQKLHLDSSFFESEVINPSIKRIKKMMGWGQKVTFTAKQQEGIATEIASSLSKFEGQYVKSRQEVLERIQKNFIANVRHEIDTDGGISQEAADFICKINPPALKRVVVKEIPAICDKLKQSEGFWIFKREYVKKDKFLPELTNYFGRALIDTIDGYTKEFCEFLNMLLSTTTQAYLTNLEEYSVLLKAKLVDKKSMEELMGKINAAADDLRKGQHMLDAIIWEGERSET